MNDDDRQDYMEKETEITFLIGFGLGLWVGALVVGVVSIAVLALTGGIP